MARVIERAKILGNSYCYFPSEKIINIRKEDEGMLTVLQNSDFRSTLQILKTLFLKSKVA